MSDPESNGHTTTVDRLRQFSTARTSTAADRLEDAQRSDAAARRTFVFGARVLDLVSGLEGVVETRGFLIRDGEQLIGVGLDRGGVVTRTRSQLLERPTPPKV